MEILFISSGNSKNGISPIIKSQGKSLRELGHNVSFFAIKGKGIKGYLNHVFVLKKYLKKSSYDVVHAHYSLSAMTASLAGAKPLVVSLMGSDVKASPILASIIKIFKNIFWRKVIVKSLDMKISSKIADARVVPNGVNFKKFKPIQREKALEITGWDANKKHVLFAANPKRKEKNYQLAKAAFDIMNDASVELHVLVDVPNNLMPYYFNASDVILLTSLWEGSPNVIKEAMACNCKIVAVDVGDIKKVIGDTYGCFVTDFNEATFAQKLKKSLHLKRKTNGREKITYLDSGVIAKELTNIYKTVEK